MFITLWLSGVLPLPIWGPPLSKLEFNYNIQSRYPQFELMITKEIETEEPKVWLFIYVFLCALMLNWSWEIENIDLTQCLTCGEGGAVHHVHTLELATQPVPRETHNYSRPFRLVQQPVQLWLHSLVVYFILFPLLRGTPRHNGQASLDNNVCDDKHSGS